MRNYSKDAKAELEWALKEAEAENAMIQERLLNLSIRLAMEMAEKEAHGRDPQHLRGEISGVQLSRLELEPKVGESKTGPRHKEVEATA